MSAQELHYKPVNPGDVPAHVRDAFAEKHSSNPPSGWHWQTWEGGSKHFHWIRDSEGNWLKASVVIK